MALIDDINNLPTTVGDGNTGHLNNHQVIHAALKDHEVRLGARHLIGTGSPEGKITAAIGTQYTDQAATAGAIRWIKTSGTGATGWTVEYGDTGWRRILPVGEYFTGDGSILFRRIDNRVTIRFAGVGVNNSLTPFVYLTAPGFIPVGFRVDYGDRPSFWVSNSNANPNYLITVAQGSRIRYQESNSPTAANPGTGSLAMQGQGSWVSEDAWPTILPGTPA